MTSMMRQKRNGKKKIRKKKLHDTPVNAKTKKKVVANDYAYSVASSGDSYEAREDNAFNRCLG